MRISARALPAMLLALLPMTLPAADTEGPGIDRIIVKWRSTSSDAASRQLHVRGFAQRLGEPQLQGRDLGGSLSVLQLAARQRGRQLADTLAALRADPAVEIAEADLHMRALAYVPSDPLFSTSIAFGGRLYDYQWYLKGAQPAAIRANVAWDITRGGANAATSPVVIAVVDTGIRPNHPDLAGKLLPGFDFISIPTVANDGDGWDADPTDPGDYITQADLASGPFADRSLKCGGGPDHDQEQSSTWHGTSVAGLIGANTDNAIGMAGAGFNIRIVPVRVLGKCGGALSDVLAGMYWAAGFFDAASGRPIPAPLLSDPGLLHEHPNAHPAQIINLSLGAVGACSATYATAVREITALGVLIVAAAGNDGSAVDQPANCPGALAVAGLRHTGTKVGYSSLGPEVGIAAPAGNCVLTAPGDPCLFALNTLTNLGAQASAADDYSTPLVHASYGTSFSAPLVAATAGLMRTVNPALTPALLIARIRQAARPFPSRDELGTTLACTVPSTTPPADPPPCVCNTQVCGAGMLDAGAAVQQATRPAALISVQVTDKSFLLDGSASAAAAIDSRMLVSHEWTVVSAAGGATTPTISNAGQAIASVPAPSQGSVIVQLTVTDNLGAIDTAFASLTATGGSSDTAPPASEIHRGSGSLDMALLGLFALLLMARRARRVRPIFQTHQD